MMSLNSKQPFAMAHTSLPEPKYSLHSSSSSTSNAPSSSCSSSRHSSSTIISSSGGSSSEAMRRACLPTPPVRILHNHRLKAHFDSPLFFYTLSPFFFCLMFFSCLHSKSPNTSIFPPFLRSSTYVFSSTLPFLVLIFMTWDVACVLFCVCAPTNPQPPPSIFLDFFFHPPPQSGNVLNRRVEGEFPADSYVCILFAIAEQYIRRLG